MPLLSRLNVVQLRSKDLGFDLTPEQRSTGWCGSPPALEAEIVAAEVRLGLKLPPSYRSFLSISNGWRPFDGFVGRLLPVQEIARLVDTHPEFVAAIQGYYRADDLSDSDYLDYENEQHSEAMRPRYYPSSIVVGAGGSGGELVLLNPHTTFPDGEWETIFFASWIPGNERYRCFRDYVEFSVGSYEEHEVERSARAGRTT